MNIVNGGAALATLYRLYYIFVCDESNLIIFRYLSTHL